MTAHRAPSSGRTRWGAITAGAVLAVGVVAGGVYAANVADEPESSWSQILGQHGATIDAQIDALEEQVAALQTGLEQATVDRDAALAEIVELEAQIADLQTQLDAATASPSPSPSATASPTPRQMLVGSSLHREAGESHTAAYERRCTNWGACPEIVRYFYSGLPSGPWPQFGDSVEVVSFKVPSMAGFAAGNNDVQVRSWLAGIPNDGTPHYVTVWHEPEDDVEARRFTSADFRAGVQHLQDLAAEFTGTGKRIRVGVVLMGYTVQASSGRNVDNYLVPGLHFIGWDVYTSPTDPNDTRTKYGLASSTCERVTVVKCFITETAPRVSSGITQTQKAAWIPVAFDIARAQGFDGVMYFDSTVGGDFRLQSPEAHDAIGLEIAK